jgi:trimeric autotransporter adhesin
MIKLLLSASATALVIAAGTGLAAAQSSSGSAAMTGGEMAAADYTCGDIAQLDSAKLPQVLYYIKGYMEGQEEAGSHSSAGMTTDPSHSTTAGTASSETAASAADSGATSGSATTDDTASASSDTNSASTQESAAETGATGTTTTETAAAADSADAATGDTMASSSDSPDSSASPAGTGTDEMHTASIRGFEQIEVEQVMSACQADSTAKLSDILEQMGSAN